MARQARQSCETQCYHVIARGVGKQIIYETEEDYRFFRHLMTEYAIKEGVLLGAYCLMSNHFHLLIHDESGHLSGYMHGLMGTYAVYFNQKHDRCGHLFQERFRSVPIESDTKYCTVMRYILLNPEKAGICDAESYPWSSYRDYSGKRPFMDNQNLARLLCAQDQLAEFLSHCDPAESELYDFSKDDSWAERVACAALQISSGREVEKMALKERNNAIICLRKKGLSVRQIQRVTGVGRGVIQKVTE